MKKWEVTLSDWYGGRFERFWFKKNALAFAKAHKRYFLWVDLNNLWTGESTRLKDTDTSKYYRTQGGEYIAK